jgi:hypothetical protein
MTGGLGLQDPLSFFAPNTYAVSRQPADALPGAAPSRASWNEKPDEIM